MPPESKVVRSDRFTLSVTGFALIVLIVLIVLVGTSAQANANVAGITHRQLAPMAQKHHSKEHALFITGDVDFDYAANLQLHQKLALEMSIAQLKNGKSQKLRVMATRLIAEQKNQIALLDRWLATQTRVRSKTLPHSN